MTKPRRSSAAPGFVALAPAWFTMACSFPGPAAPRDAADTLSATTTTITIAGEPTRVRAFRAGEPTGVPVLYVHGTPGDALGWRDYLLDPVPGTESIALDRPGFGGSSADRVVPALADQAAALEPLLDPDRPAILVGHSLGARWPDRVAGLVLVAGSLDPDLEKVLLIQRLGEFPPLAAILPRWLRNTNRELIPLEAELRALGPRLARITAPVEILHGTRDAQVPYANVDYMLTRFPNATSVRVTKLVDMNHFLPWNSATYLRTAIARLVEDVPYTRA